MRILFIDPPGIGRPRENKRGMNLNLAIAGLASILIQQNHKVSLLDMENHNENRAIKSVDKSLNTFKPHIICISIINAQYMNAVALIKHLHKATNVPIVVGGAEITAVEEKVFHDTDFAVNISVLGEGEESLVRIVNYLEKDQLSELESVKGIIINEGGSLKKTGPSQVIKNIDCFPLPEFDLFGLKRVKNYKILGSRGCPYNCSFCFNYLGRTSRCRSPENIIKELQTVRDKYDFESFRFEDANFNFRPDWTRKVCDAIMNSDLYGLPWGAAVRADKLDRELCKHMADAGCKKVHIGVESLHSEVFRHIEKGESIEQIKKGVRIAQEYFDQVQIFLIIGLPGDTKERALYTYREAIKLGNLEISYSLAVPYSKTRMEEWIKSNAIVHGGSYDSFTRGSDAYKNGVAFETEDFTESERLNIFRKLNTKSYRYLSKSRFRILTPLAWLKDAILYDGANITNHIFHISRDVKERFKMEMKMLRNDASEWYIDYQRIPDGTWWLG